MQIRSPSLRRAILALFAALFFALPQAAQAQVMLSFHSFNGSYFGGRYPHTFIVLEGSLEGTGERVNENYGFSAKSIGPSVLMGPVEHGIFEEEQKYISSTNRHFTVQISDAMYRAVVQEMKVWRDAPGKGYDLDNRNCIHFVGRIAQMVGIKVSYPWELRRKPKEWLNHVAKLNPRLNAKQIP